MKENSKEKLERQLNDNPELKERFNLQMKSITNNVRALTEPLTELTDNLNSQLEAFRFHAEELRVSTTKKYKILESDYNTLVAKYLSYLKKEGMILPLDFNEFFSWIASCRYPDEPFAILEIQPNDFKLFHEYEKRRINNTGWNENKEWLFLNNHTKSDDNEFSAIQWGAIFYYADTTKLLTGKNITDKLEAFHKKHNINITVKYFRQKYYKAVDQLNKCNNYPIEKLEAIIPFLEQHYKHTVTKVKNDIEILQDYKDEYE